MFFVYVLQSEIDRRFYTGFTENVDERVKMHNRGGVQSTRNRRPMTLMYYEASRNVKDAIHREKYLKTTYGKRYLRNRLRNDLGK